MAEPAVESPLDTPPASRLVIRVKLTSEPVEQPPPPPARRGVSATALLVIGAVAVAVVLIWFGIRTFRSEPVSAPAITEPAANSEPTASTPPAAVASKPVEPQVQQPPDAPPTAVNEVIPDVPQSALDTIRGTVRVSVRVVIDKHGTVIAATPHDRGPSRYFARLSVDASKQWTFTPATSEEQRTMLVRFNFTRSGVTADAGPLQ